MLGRPAMGSGALGTDFLHEAEEGGAGRGDPESAGGRLKAKGNSTRRV